MSRVIPVENTPRIMEIYTKIFLSVIDIIDHSMKVDNLGGKDSSTINQHIPYWLLKYNYLSLLNLTEKI